VKVWKPKTSYAATQDGDWPKILAEVAACETTESVDEFWNDYILRRMRDNPEVWSLEIRAACEARREELEVMNLHAEMDRQWSDTVR